MIHIIKDVFIANILKTGITEIKLFTFMLMYYVFVYANSESKKSLYFLLSFDIFLEYNS